MQASSNLAFHMLAVDGTWSLALLYKYSRYRQTKHPQRKHVLSASRLRDERLQPVSCRVGFRC
jgi:hypothetical protein